ncbi:MAG: hypothetical protein PF638_03365 [Candidatus Delongbacteria bacterium]|jgi:hypothetical protein|nr:hypothetical protein [Candidatus Delongbacteria bacterium]
MLKIIGNSFSILTISLFLLTTFAHAQTDSLKVNVREKLPLDMGIELLGKSYVYTISAQFIIKSHFGIQAGISSLGTGRFMSVGGNIYMSKQEMSPFLTGGIVNLSVSDDPDSDDSDSEEGGTYGYGGIGFEYRSEKGFVFRGVVYIMNDHIWPGLHMGFSF